MLASPETLKRFAREARGDQDAGFRAAEIVLNLDMAIALLPREGMGGFDSRVDVMQELDRNGLDPALRSRWRLAVAAVYLQFHAPRKARQQIEKALDAAKDDPLLLAVLGATYEQEASGGPAPKASLGVVEDWSTWSRYYLGKAREAYEKALRGDPERADARLRLAWNLAQGADPDRGLEHARWVRDHAEAPDLRYVALLLSGRALERRGQPAEAVEQYLEACGVDPRGSVAPFAASRALRTLGRREEARELLLRALRARDAGEYVDAWQGHHQGRAVWLSDAVAALRRSVPSP